MLGSIPLGFVLIILILLALALAYAAFVAPEKVKMGQLFAFVSLLGVVSVLAYIFWIRILENDPNPMRLRMAHYLTQDKLIDPGQVVPGVYDTLDYVQRIDTDVPANKRNDESAEDEWLVFYKYDVVNAEALNPRGPFGAAIYESDGCRPPSILAFELVPVSYDYLGEDSISARVENIIEFEDPLSASLDRPELIISGVSRGVTTDLNVFRKAGIKMDYCQPGRQVGALVPGLQLNSAFSYQNIGSFRGSYRVSISTGDSNKNTVDVWDRGGFERSQFTIRRQYRPGNDGSYFRPGDGATFEPVLLDPVEFSLDFGPGQPDLVSNVYYPEKAVLAFYLNLTKDSKQLAAAKEYLSPKAQERYDIKRDSFGLSTDPNDPAQARDKLVRVLVWEIRYDPDIEAEQRHQERTVGVTVVGVAGDGRHRGQYACQVTWKVKGISNSQALPYGCEWRLDSYESNCQP
jgi:hypothetical protein